MQRFVIFVLCAVLGASAGSAQDLAAVLATLRESHGEIVRELESGRLDEAVGLLRREQKQDRAGAEIGALLDLLRRAEAGSPEAVLELVAIVPRPWSKSQVVLLERALREAPKSEQVLLAYGRANLDAGLAFPAADALGTLVGLFPDVAEYHALYGRALLGRGSEADALEALRQAEALDPDARSIQLAFGEALNELKRYDEAAAHLRRALEAEPGDLAATTALAVAETELGELDAAESRIDEVLARAPDDVEALFLLGMIRMKQDRFADARARLERVVEIAPDHAKAWYQLSLACMRLGERERAQEHLERYKHLVEPLLEKAN